MAADDLEATIAGIRLALQAVNGSRAWDAKESAEKLHSGYVTAEVSSGEDTQRWEEKDQLELDIERLRLEKQQLESDINLTENFNRFQPTFTRAAAPRASRAARATRAAAPPMEQYRNPDEPPLSALGRSVTNAIPQKSPPRAQKEEETVDKLYQMYFPNGFEPRPSSHPPPEQIQQHSQSRGHVGDDDVGSFYGSQSSSHSQRQESRPASIWNPRSFAPTSAPNVTEYAHALQAETRQRKGIWQLVPDGRRSAPFVDTAYSDYGYSDYETAHVGNAPEAASMAVAKEAVDKVAAPKLLQRANRQQKKNELKPLEKTKPSAVRAAAPKLQSNKSQKIPAWAPEPNGGNTVVYSDYGGIFSMEDLATPPQTPKHVGARRTNISASATTPSQGFALATCECLFQASTSDNFPLMDLYGAQWNEGEILHVHEENDTFDLQNGRPVPPKAVRAAAPAPLIYQSSERPLGFVRTEDTDMVCVEFYFCLIQYKHAIRSLDIATQ